MKVGILSIQKVMNYGSFLQGFALKRTIEELGYECEFIDLEQDKIYPAIKMCSFLFNKKTLNVILNGIFLLESITQKSFSNASKMIFSIC